LLTGPVGATLGAGLTRALGDGDVDGIGEGAVDAEADGVGGRDAVALGWRTAFTPYATPTPTRSATIAKSACVPLPNITGEKDN
jgi:hypothetical protein